MSAGRRSDGPPQTEAVPSQNHTPRQDAADHGVGSSDPTDAPRLPHEEVSDLDVGAQGASSQLRRREGAVSAREGTATQRESVAGIREGAVLLREETSALREEALHAREDAAHARAESEQLTAQIRQVNERLVVTSLQAQAMAEDAERANHLKDEFLATVSHELRTPLNAVLGWTRMLRRMDLPPDRAAAALDTIERNAAALVRIINDLLDVSRITSNKFNLEAEAVDLLAVTHAALEAVRPMALASQVELTLSTGSSPIDAVRGDAGRLEQVIWNLLTNAIKFTPEGGRVAVSVAQAASEVEVTVIDTGQGIRGEFLPHVFDRFRQADASTTRRHTGLGLGLAIVRQLVLMHGGTVRAHSAGEGRGSTFSVRLPVIRSTTRHSGPAGDPSALASQPTTLSQPLQGLRILVVDDNGDGRKLTSLMLTQAGATVRGAATAREALGALEHAAADALVSDIGLPGEDGYALIQQVRRAEGERGGFLPALALTGYAGLEDREKSLEAGFQAYVCKPVDPTVLTETILRITDRQGAGS